MVSGIFDGIMYSQDVFTIFFAKYMRKGIDELFLIVIHIISSPHINQNVHTVC